MTTIRAAIILLYTQLFTYRTFSLISYTILAVNVTFGVSAIIANCLICRPIQYRWSPNIVTGICGDVKALDLDTAILNLLHDVVLVVLPIPILWRLQLASTKKVILICTFGIGIMYGTPIHQFPVAHDYERLIHVSAAVSVLLLLTASTRPLQWAIT